MTSVITALYPTDMVLIQQITAINTQFVTFNNIPSTYGAYILFMMGVSTLNNGDQLAMQISPDNVSWVGGQQGWQSAFSTPGFASLGQNITLIQLLNSTPGFATGYKANGQVYIPQPTPAIGLDKQLLWQIGVSYNTPQVNVFDGALDYPNTANHIRLFGWNGAAATGLYGFFSLYGIVGA